MNYRNLESGKPPVKKIFLIYMMFVCNLFYQFGGDDKSVQRLQMLVVVLGVLYAAIFVKSIAGLRYTFAACILMFYLLFAQELIVCSLLLKQSLLDSFMQGKYYLFLLMYFILSYHIKTLSSFFRAYRMYIIFSTVIAVLFIVQYYSLSIFKMPLLEVPFSKRFEDIRIPALGYFIDTGVIFALGMALNSAYKLRDRFIALGCVIIGLFELVLVQKTRVSMLIVAVCILIMLAAAYRHNLTRLVLAAGLLAIVVFALSNVPLFKEYISSVDSDDNSFVVRSNAVGFYISQLKEHPFYGMGFIKDVDDRETIYMLKGPDKKFFRSDVGIVGFTNTFGLLGFAWYIYMIGKMIFYVFHRFSKKEKYLNIGILGAVLYILLSTATLIFMDEGRIMILPVVLAFIDYITSATDLETNADTGVNRKWIKCV